MRKMIEVPKFQPDDRVEHADMVPTAIDLPRTEILDAGVKKFLEMANLYWPGKGGVITFDPKNKAQLRMTLGLVYYAMREAADGL